MFAYYKDFKGPVHQRTTDYRERILSSKRSLSTARLKAYTEAYEEFKAEEVDILRAKSMYKFLTEMPIMLHDQEMFAVT
jgi:hypothetical protein